MKVRDLVVVTALVLSSGSTAFGASSAHTRMGMHLDMVRTCGQTYSSLADRWRCATGRGAATTAAIVAAPARSAAAAMSYKKGDDATLKCVMKRSNPGCDAPMMMRMKR